MYLTGSHGPRDRCPPLTAEGTRLREVKKPAEGRAASQRRTDTRLCWTSSAVLPPPLRLSAVPCGGELRWGSGPGPGTPTCSVHDSEQQRGGRVLLAHWLSDGETSLQRDQTPGNGEEQKLNEFPPDPLNYPVPLSGDVAVKDAEHREAAGLEKSMAPRSTNLPPLMP